MIKLITFEEYDIVCRDKKWFYERQKFIQINLGTTSYQLIFIRKGGQIYYSEYPNGNTEVLK